MSLSKARYPRFLTLLHQPWPISPAIAPKLNSSQPIEEENSPYYGAERYYPARLGEVLHGRYQLATKVGHGSNSTVWLARDLRRFRWLKERYVTIKINATANPVLRSNPQSELEMTKRVSTVKPSRGGWRFVRKLVDHFELKGMHGNHICLALEPLREPLWLFCRRWIGGVIPPDVVRPLVGMVLEGLDFLHSDCQMIHTDLKPDNIMLKVEDSSILERDVEDEFHNPLPQKHTDDGRIIYLARNNYGRLREGAGVVQIIDFGLAVMGNVPQSGAIQAEIYRAPEVIADSEFTYSADGWNLGVMLWGVLEGKELFNNVNREDTDEYDDHVHLAHITALLGPAPVQLTDTRRMSRFYGTDGLLKEPPHIPADFSFESTIASMEGEEKKMFIAFVKRMIKWRPEERSTARELLSDPWLYTDFADGS